MPLPSELLLSFFFFLIILFILKLALVYFRNCLLKIFKLYMHCTFVLCFIRTSSASTWGPPKSDGRSSPVQRIPAYSFMIPYAAQMRLTWKEAELPSSVGSVSLKQMSKKHPRKSVLPQIPTHLPSSDGWVIHQGEQGPQRWATFT